jgi:hypothetical protein
MLSPAVSKESTPPRELSTAVTFSTVTLETFSPTFPARTPMLLSFTRTSWTRTLPTEAPLVSGTTATALDEASPETPNPSPSRSTSLAVIVRQVPLSVLRLLSRRYFVPVLPSVVHSSTTVRSSVAVLPPSVDVLPPVVSFPPSFARTTVAPTSAVRESSAPTRRTTTSVNARSPEPPGPPCLPDSDFMYENLY